MPRLDHLALLCQCPIKVALSIRRKEDRKKSYVVSWPTFLFQLLRMPVNGWQALMRLKQDKAGRTESSKITVVGRRTIQSFKWCLIVSNRSRQPINGVNSSKGSLSQKGCRNLREFNQGLPLRIGGARIGLETAWLDSSSSTECSGDRKRVRQTTGKWRGLTSMEG